MTKRVNPLNQQNKRTIAPRYPLAVALAISLCAVRVSGQNIDVEFVSRSTPTPAFVNPEPARYNLKFGKLNARLHGSMQVEYNDNINLSEVAPKKDLLLNPHLRVGFVYPLSAIQLLELNLGVGYRYYLDSRAVNSFNIDPKSRIDYRITLFRDVEMKIYDAFSITVDPTSRPDISGDTGLIDFRRLNNTVGTLLNWQLTSDWRVSGGYSYSISRSLNEEFKSLDLDTHTFSAGTYYTVSPRLTVGLNGSYSFMHYATNFQNNAESYQIGPMMVFKPTEFITVSGMVGFSVLDFDQTGTIADRSQSRGVVGQLGIQHRINRWLNHDLQLSEGRDLGVGSNFNQTFIAQYGLSTRMGPDFTVRSTFGYEATRGSGPLGEDSKRYIYYIGTGMKLSRHWGMGLGYSLILKDSDLPDRDYTQNRVTLDLTREF